VSISVALAAGQPASYRLAAQFCAPQNDQGRKILVTVPGATYNGKYYNASVDPAVYNYADKAVAAGWAVLDVDRLGTGGSSRPVSTMITAQASAYAIHQAIQYARQQLGYKWVALEGHSVGSAIASLVAGTWPQDINALVLTGYLNVPIPVSDLSTGFGESVTADPGTDWYCTQSGSTWSSCPWADSGLDAGYVTTPASPPGVRAAMFYYNGDPAVEAWDDANKDAVSMTEAATAMESVSSTPGTGITTAITAPVLIIDGALDAFLCTSSTGPSCSDWAAMTMYEQPFFPAAASLTAVSVPDTGHDLALNTSAPESFAMINSWLQVQAAAG
jgi:pimeloyl-ACP methyl ester carboxylesterase